MKRSIIGVVVFVALPLVVVLFLGTRAVEDLVAASVREQLSASRDSLESRHRLLA